MRLTIARIRGCARLTPLCVFSALVWPCVVIYAYADTTKIGQTISDNCGPAPDLTGIGVYQLVVSVVTAVAAVAIMRRWRRAPRLGVAGMLALVLMISSIALLDQELNTMRLC